MTDRPVNGAPAGPFLDDDFELLQLDRELKDARFETQPIGFFKDAAIRLCHNGAALAALVLILIVIFMAAFGPGMNKYGYNDQYIDYVNMPPKIPFLAQFGMADGSRVLQNRRLDNVNDPEKMPQDAILEIFNEREVRGVTMVDVKVDYYLYTGCGETFWFGTDYLGRDLWTRLWRGTRISLFIAIISVLTNVVIGVVYGSVAGYYGGKVDMVMMRICEIIQSFPRVVIATLFIMVFGTGLFSIIMSLLISGWISTARMIRSQFYRFKDREYVLAARTMGISDRSIIFRYILPNSLGPIITSTMIAVPSAIFTESFLAYIGLGLQAPEPSIGVLLSEGQKVLLNYPFQSLFPGIVISVLMICFNLFGNGLRDAMDPTLRGT
ncbi:MAG: ABC transporter permease [Eubacteriales bacterium]|nr:ABC transporter permease [Eubacteriales bacterium]